MTDDKPINITMACEFVQDRPYCRIYVNDVLWWQKPLENAASIMEMFGKAGQLARELDPTREAT